MVTCGREFTGSCPKVYDDLAYRPASTHTFVGILSSSPMPSTPALDSNELCTVPTIHVVTPSMPAYPLPSSTLDQQQDDGGTRTHLIAYLATAFDPPDHLAAEYLLLALLSAPTSRPITQPPLGTLSVNFLRSATMTATARFISTVSSITPLVVPLSLTIPFLHSTTFSPSSTDSSTLNAGLLQLGAGTLLVIEEDGMGEGGALNEKAVKNINALIECVSLQTVRYFYPYMDGLKMDCSVRAVVLSAGKSLLPVSEDLSLSTMLIRY